MNFVKFEMDKIESCLDFMRQLKVKQQKLHGSKPAELRVMATGGGAYKYYDTIKAALGVEVSREDEMECLIMGLSRSFVVMYVLFDLTHSLQGSTFSSRKSQTKSSHTAKSTRCDLWRHV